MTEFNPYQAPEADLTLREPALDAGPLRPVPFEDIELEPRFWPRVWAMFPALFRGPLELAERVPVTRGLGAPWRFQLVLTIPIFLLIIAIAAVLGAVMLFAAQAGPAGGPPVWLFALLPLVYLLLLPPIQFLNMIVIGALSHGCLWLWGGTRQSQGTTATLRLTGYFLGFFMLVGFIPIIGSLAALAGPAFLGLAMARVHRTDPWRGVCAAYTPMAVLIGAVIVMFVVIFALVR